MSPPRSGEGPWIGRKVLLSDTPRAEPTELRLPSAVGDVPEPEPGKPCSRCCLHDDHHDIDHGRDWVRRKHAYMAGDFYFEGLQ